MKKRATNTPLTPSLAASAAAPDPAAIADCFERCDELARLLARDLVNRCEMRDTLASYMKVSREFRNAGNGAVVAWCADAQELQRIRGAHYVAVRSREWARTTAELHAMLDRAFGKGFCMRYGRTAEVCLHTPHTYASMCRRLCVLCRRTMADEFEDRVTFELQRRSSTGSASKASYTFAHCGCQSRKMVSIGGRASKCHPFPDERVVDEKWNATKAGHVVTAILVQRQDIDGGKAIVHGDDFKRVCRTRCSPHVLMTHGCANWPMKFGNPELRMWVRPSPHVPREHTLLGVLGVTDEECETFLQMAHDKRKAIRCAAALREAQKAAKVKEDWCQIYHWVRLWIGRNPDIRWRALEELLNWHTSMRMLVFPSLVRDSKIQPNRKSVQESAMIAIMVLNGMFRNRKLKQATIEAALGALNTGWPGTTVGAPFCWGTVEKPAWCLAMLEENRTQLDWTTKIIHHLDALSRRHYAIEQIKILPHSCLMNIRLVTFWPHGRKVPVSFGCENLPGGACAGTQFDRLRLVCGELELNDPSGAYMSVDDFQAIHEDVDLADDAKSLGMCEWYAELVDRCLKVDRCRETAYRLLGIPLALEVIQTSRR